MDNDGATCNLKGEKSAMMMRAPTRQGAIASVRGNTSSYFRHPISRSLCGCLVLRAGTLENLLVFLVRGLWLLVKRTNSTVSVLGVFSPILCAKIRPLPHFQLELQTSLGSGRHTCRNPQATVAYLAAVKKLDIRSRGNGDKGIFGLGFGPVFGPRVLSEGL